MLTSLLSRTALAALPAAGPVAAVLVPVLARVLTRDIEIHVSIR